MSPKFPLPDSPAAAALDVLSDVNDALRHARMLHPSFRSVMEAEAAIREEIDELTQAIRAGYASAAPLATTLCMRTEALHLAAMAVKFLVDCPENPDA